MNALAVVVREISTNELRSNLVIFLTLGISTPFVIKIPNFGQMLLSSNQSITLSLDALAVLVCEISTNELRSNLVIFLT